ncbi:MAG: hypothetical protein ACUVWP_07525 [bacterium]
MRSTILLFLLIFSIIVQSETKFYHPEIEESIKKETIRIFKYPQENVSIPLPLIIRPYFYWETISSFTIFKGHSEEQGGAIMTTPLGIRLLIEGPMYALYIKLFTYLVLYSNINMRWMGEQLYTNNGENKISAFANFNIQGYLRFINIKNEPLIWIGGGFESIFPSVKFLLSFPIGKYRLQAGLGMMFDRWFDKGEIYTLSLNFETMPLYNNERLWGVKGEFLLHNQIYNNSFTKETLGKKWTIWGGFYYAIL